MYQSFQFLSFFISYLSAINPDYRNNYILRITMNQPKQVGTSSPENTARVDQLMQRTREIVSSFNLIEQEIFIQYAKTHRGILELEMARKPQEHNALPEWTSSETVAHAAFLVALDEEMIGKQFSKTDIRNAINRFVMDPGSLAENIESGVRYGGPLSELLRPSGSYAQTEKPASRL
jgi:hypothetical protein